jgi:DNA-binding NtrC family response regulator
LTGLNLSKEILNIRPDIPVILCTGYSELVNQEIATKSGIKKFLLKPVDSNFLAHTIYELLRKNSSHVI